MLQQQVLFQKLTRFRLEDNKILIQFLQQITDLGQVLTFLYPLVATGIIITAIQNMEVAQTVLNLH